MLCGHSALYSATWPTSGMTRRGAAYARPTWEPHTSDSGSSSLLPTPTARDHKGANQRDDPTSLHGALLPTPRASDTGTPGRRSGSGFGPPLSQVINEQLLPTPKASDGRSGSPNYRSSSGRDTLPSAAFALLPTPRTGTKRTGIRWAQRPADQGGASGASLEQALELAMGVLPQEFQSWEQVPNAWISAATSPLSNDGSTNSADRHPHLPSTDAEAPVS
jgi:hypothetical protein